MDFGSSMRRPMLLGTYGIPYTFSWKVKLAGGAFIKRDGDLNIENRMIAHPM